MGGWCITKGIFHEPQLLWLLWGFLDGGRMEWRHIGKGISIGSWFPFPDTLSAFMSNRGNISKLSSLTSRESLLRVWRGQYSVVLLCNTTSGKWNNKIWATNDDTHRVDCGVKLCSPSHNLMQMWKMNNVLHFLSFPQNTLTHQSAVSTINTKPRAFFCFWVIILNPTCNCRMECTA